MPFPGRTVGEVIDFLKAKSKEMFPETFTYDFQGESRQYVQEGNRLVVTFIFALIIIYLVLAAQYESFRDPLIILIALPTSIFGALLPLTARARHGQHLHADRSRDADRPHLQARHPDGRLRQPSAGDEGLGRREAIEEAAAIRLRPILMTTAAMVIAMVPLIFATGAGAASRFAIGVVIASGMTIGTLFTLFVTPAVYTYIAREHRRRRRGRRTCARRSRRQDRRSRAASRRRDRRAP